MSSPSEWIASYFPGWLTDPRTTEQEQRLQNYRDMIIFLQNKGIEYTTIPYQLFELIQAYVQDGTPVYYQDPVRRFTIWVGTGPPDENSTLFFRA